MKRIHSTDGPNFSSVVQKAQGSFSWAIKFFDVNMTESAYERPPDLWPDPIPNGHSNIVYLVTDTLVRTKMRNRPLCTARQWSNIFATVASKRPGHPFFQSTVDNKKRTLLWSCVLFSFLNAWIPLVYCRGSALFLQYTVSRWHYIFCSHPRTERKKICSSGQQWLLNTKPKKKQGKQNKKGKTHESTYTHTFISKDI